ncbi:MAG: murein biosynthesis integral membrane protein MurJ, partial [Rhodocyclaceae bacterium]|nr:murein biosynthesis integral membrane protein MurJ [Rhodocyclaceae bacterium]
GVIGAPLLIYVSAPGFSADTEKFELTVLLTRIVFPYILFMSLTALAAGVLNTWSKFAVPAATPALLNLAFIAMALFAAPYFDPPVLVLAWAVLLGGVLQLGAQLIALQRIGMLPRPSFTLKDSGVNRILKLMAPAILGVSVSQISLVINTIFASFLAAGSVSWLYYADRLMEFPSGLLGAALGTILLPSLSKLHAQDRREEFSSLLDWGLRLTLLLTLPAALALAILAVPLLSTLFQHGAFTADDVLQTRSALVAYSAGLSGLILVKVLAPAFYSRQDVRTPVRIALVTLALTQIMNLAFIVPLKHAGLALSIGIASVLNALLLYRGLRRRGAYTPRPGWGKFSLRLLGALAVMGGVLWWVSGDAQYWLTAPGSARLLRLSGIVALGIAVYLGSLFALGFRLKDFRQRAA